MPQRSWTAKRERQYEHVKEGLLEAAVNRRTGRSHRGDA